MDVLPTADIEGTKLELAKFCRFVVEMFQGTFWEYKDLGRLPETSTVCCKLEILWCKLIVGPPIVRASQLQQQAGK